MIWEHAVAMMREGFTVNRKSEMWTRVLDPGDPELDDIQHAPTIESGQEGMRLMHAWSVDEKPVLVFCGADSKCFVVPDDEHRSATDWVVVVEGVLKFNQGGNQS